MAELGTGNGGGGRGADDLEPKTNLVYCGIVYYSLQYVPETTKCQKQLEPID